MRLQSYISIISLLFLGLNAQANEPFFSSKMSITSKNFYSIYIMDQGKTNTVDLVTMLQFYNPEIDNEYAHEIARLYIQESFDEGVNHDIAFCQMVLETGFLAFGGSVYKNQNNFCGLGATGGLVRGESFPDMQTGIRAHIQHLKAYASKQSISKKSVDKRFRFVRRGSAPTIYALQGKWAADPLYDDKIEGLLIRLFTHRSLMANKMDFR